VEGNVNKRHHFIYKQFMWLNFHGTLAAERSPVDSRDDATEDFLFSKALAISEGYHCLH
jgi:hypothetical protein